MADDAQLSVRYQVAFSLGELPSSSSRNAALVKLAKRDLTDGYVRVAVLSSLSDAASAANVGGGSGGAGRRRRGELGGLAGRRLVGSRRRKTFAETPAAGVPLAKANSPALPTVIQRLGARIGTPLAEQIAVATGGKAETLMKSLLADAAKRAGTRQRR